MKSPKMAQRLGIMVILIATVGSVWAFQAPEKKPIAGFDRRPSTGATTASLSEVEKQAEAQLRERVSGLQVKRDVRTRSPRWIGSPNGFLTRTRDVELKRTGALGLKTDDPDRPVKAFLIENAALVGHGAEVLEKTRVLRDYMTAHNGLRTVVWQQELEGIPVYEGVLSGHVTAKDELVNLSSQCVPELEKAAGSGVLGGLRAGQPLGVTARRAMELALAEAGQDSKGVEPVAVAKPGPEKRQEFKGGSLSRTAHATLVWLPMSGTSVRLCWQVYATVHSTGEAFESLVDATTGKVWVQRGRTYYYTAASYRVYTGDSPAPMTPGLATPGTTQASVVNRELVTLAALSPTASPNGWVDDGTDVVTVGNNVDAGYGHVWFDENNEPQYEWVTPSGVGRVFDHPLNLAEEPYSYMDASTVNLFYWCNWMHDRLYALGFTEAAGNFQQDNFGRGGSEEDPVDVRMEVTDNAYFNFAPDGEKPTIQMGTFTSMTPDRASALDAEVILHEYAHGLSTRLLNGQFRDYQFDGSADSGLGEGWSDYYSVALLSQAGDALNGNYPVGGYLTYLAGGMDQNYYYGIRRYPYSTNMAKNPLTYRDIDPTQASSHTGIPRSPIAVTLANEPHNSGEVWCSVLWEARANLVARYGFATGNELMLQLVTDGIRLCPGYPNFVEARDALLQADLVDRGGANHLDLWTAFAKRGLGWGATAPDSSTTEGVVESFSLPPQATQAPAWWVDRAVIASGPTAADFAVANQGQAKWFALQAEAELMEKLPVGFRAKIYPVSGGQPDGLPTGDNYRTINQGQLKNLVKPLYDRIQQARAANPTLPITLPQGSPGIYPWTDATGDDQSYAPVNIGQLKYTLSFEFDKFTQ